jgi:tetratricopeptide (TPR) repeat protein
VRSASHPTIKEAMENWNPTWGVRTFAILIIAFSSGAISLSAQAQSTAAPQSPSNGAASPANPQKTKSKQEANPFPDDTNSVPVLPSANGTATPADEAGSSALPLPGSDSDPVRSPDDASEGTAGSATSSSSAGLDNLLKPPPDEDQGKHRKLAAPEPTHTENAKEDESVGNYYLDQKNWKAALSRFESALVLDPENPDVYWGLAESARHLGDYGRAKANYQKVIEYDPDSKHAKEANKFLKAPELANAKAVSTTSSAPPPQH